DYYLCPFVREKGDGTHHSLGNIKLTGPSGSMLYELQEFKGKHESYWTWKWEGLTVKGEVPTAAGNTEIRHPNDPIEGRPKYSMLSWNSVYAKKYDPVGRLSTQWARFISPDFISFNDKASLYKHRKWSAQDAQRVKAASLSEVTVIYCGQGMTTGRHTTPKLRNYTSHRTSLGAGTNVLFADAHVEWVKGTQVGW
ncbi:MAG: hypothetical protein ACYTBZ_28380, partial [Planctomycetota bacterium]